MSFNRRNFVKSLGTLGILTTLNQKEVLAIPINPKDFNFTSLPYLQNFNKEKIIVMATFSKPCFAWLEILDKENRIINTIYQIEDGMRNANNELFKFRVNHRNENFIYRVVAKEILKFEAYKIEYGLTIQSEITSTDLPLLKNNTVNLLILNDIHENTATYNDLYTLSTLPQKDLIILNGDSVHYANSKNDIINKMCNPISKAFGSKIPFIVVRGNHETRGSYAREFKKHFDYPHNNYYQSFLLGSVFVIILDGGEDKPDNEEVYAGTTDYDNYRLEQKEWLTQELTAKKRKKAKHTIIINHIPWLHSDDWHGTKHNYHCFHEITNKYNVDAVISGHTHENGFYPPDEHHNYYVIIGGGPKVGQRTFIEVSAVDKYLSICLRKDDGFIINAFTKQ